MFILMEDLCVTFLLVLFLFSLQPSLAFFRIRRIFTPDSSYGIGRRSIFQQANRSCYSTWGSCSQRCLHGFHNTIFFVYGSFLFIGLFGALAEITQETTADFRRRTPQFYSFFHCYKLRCLADRRRLVLSKNMARFDGVLFACYSVFPQYDHRRLVYTGVLFGLFEFSQFAVRLKEKKTVQI